MTPNSALRLYLLHGILLSIIGCGAANVDASPSSIPTVAAETPSTSAGENNPQGEAPIDEQQDSEEHQPASKPSPVSDSVFREAAFAGNIAVVAQAIEAGIDINSPDENGRTALMLAAYDGHRDIVRLLLKHEAQVNRRDAMNRTALIYSSSGKNPGTVAALLEAGADVSVVDNQERWTALMFACGEGHVEVAKLLLKHGANPLAADVDGETSLDFAMSRGHGPIVELLRKELEKIEERN